MKLHACKQTRLFQNDFIRKNKATSQIQMNAVLFVLLIHKSFLKIIGMDSSESRSCRVTIKSKSIRITNKIPPFKSLNLV